jgi:hypothetical protein
MRWRPCPNFFSIVLIVVSTTLAKSWISIGGLSLPLSDNLYFLANLRITYFRKCQLWRRTTQLRWEMVGAYTRRIWRFIWLLILFNVNLSWTRRNTFQNVSMELLYLIPGSLLPFLPHRKLRVHSRKLYRIGIDMQRYSSPGSFWMKRQNLTFIFVSWRIGRKRKDYM